MAQARTNCKSFIEVYQSTKEFIESIKQSDFCSANFSGSAKLSATEA